MKNPIFDYNKETGETSCIITDGQNIFYGIAKCHPNDKKYQSEYTGCAIAEQRAKIKILQHIKNNEIIPQIQAYEHLISTMLKSSNFNSHSYEFNRIKAEYDNLLIKYTKIKNKIKYQKGCLKDYINDRDRMNKYLELKEKKRNANN